MVTMANGTLGYCENEDNIFTRGLFRKRKRVSL